MARLNRVDEREGLAPRRDPYFMEVSQGRHIGFRKMAAGAPGTWIARAYVDGKYKHHPLGDFLVNEHGQPLAPKERYDAALAEATKWFKHLDEGGSTDPLTVKGACTAYVEKRRSEKGETAARDADGFMRRLVHDDPIANILLSKLNKTHMAAFRGRLVKHCEGNAASFNRNATPVRAALNQALEEGKVATDQAWRVALKPFSEDEGGAGKRRELTLDREERKRLLECASDEARPFFTALALLPMRPGEIAALRVEHLNVRQQALVIPLGKTKTRTVPLSPAALAHLVACKKSKLPDAWLIARADGSQWKKEAWRDEIKDAARKAKLPRATVAYTLRHSVITDLVKGDSDRGIPPLDIFTVAALAGTSVRMIEKHYGHLNKDHAAKALQQLALA